MSTALAVDAHSRPTQITTDAMRIMVFLPLSRVVRLDGLRLPQNPTRREGEETASIQAETV
jgi:hypothetical protein